MSVILLSVLNLILLSVACYSYLYAKRMEATASSWKRSYELLADKYRRSRDEYWEMSRDNANKGRRLLELGASK